MPPPRGGLERPGMQPPENNQAGMDDTEEPELELAATEDVYSYFMFVAPTEAKKEGTAATMDTAIAYFLIVLNLFFQGLLLYAVFYRVVMNTSEWRAGITQFAATPGFALFDNSGQECNTGSSMCTIEGDDVTCAPPSVQLTSRWDELDLDGDGIWTREEVMTAREDLKCKYVVDPLEVFDVIVQTVVARDHIIWIHPDVRAGLMIHKPYFTYAAGDIIMCGYRNKDMCGNVLERGFFDGALEHNTVPRVGNTMNSAMKYCYDLLKPGGFCDTTLPSTYSVWKIVSSQECLEPEYAKFTKVHPITEVAKSFLQVDYDARQAYETTKTSLFRTFLFIVLSLWALSMVYNFRQISIVCVWVMIFPSSKEAAKTGEPVAYLEDEETYEIRGIDPGHRVMVGLITAVRMAMLFTLAGIGFCMLLKCTSYMDLIMDAVSLVFILEIAGILYTQTLRPQIRDQTESLKPMVLRLSPTWLNRRPAVKDLLWLAGVFVLVIVVIWYHYVSTINPMYKALECSCIGVGENCREASQFSHEFWYNYWSVETPKVFEDVSVLRGGGQLAAPAPAAPAPGPGPAGQWMWSPAAADFHAERRDPRSSHHGHHHRQQKQHHHKHEWHKVTVNPGTETSSEYMVDG